MTKLIRYIDIAITDDNGEIMYYDKWIPRIGFMRMSKEVYER